MQYITCTWGSSVGTAVSDNLSNIIGHLKVKCNIRTTSPERVSNNNAVLVDFYLKSFIVYVNHWLEGDINL